MHQTSPLQHFRRNAQLACRNLRGIDAAQTGGVAPTSIKKGITMKHIITASLLAAVALAGCASLPDSVRGPFARSGAGHTQSDADVHQPASSSPYPQATDEGKF